MKNKTYSLRYLIIVLLSLVTAAEVACTFVCLEVYRRNYFSRVVTNEISKSAELVRYYNDDVVSNIILNQKKALSVLSEEISKMVDAKVYYQEAADLKNYILNNNNQRPYYSSVNDTNSYSVVVPIVSMGNQYGYMVANGSVNKDKIAGMMSMSYMFLLLNVIFVLIVVAVVYRLFYHCLYRPIHSVVDDISLPGPHNSTRKRKPFGLNLAIFEIESLKEYLHSVLAKMRENASLVSIGQSTAMVAHDVRKPLTSMKALLTALPAIKDDPAEIEKMIANVDRNIASTNAMLNDILEFSRDATALDLKDADPQGIVTSALGDALRNHPNSDVKIDYDLRHTKALCVDGGRTIRVLTNIIDNALDAMTPNGGKAFGTIKISSREAEREGKRWLSVTVADGGPGIPADIIGRIFDPFFTQGKKGGTGLGLAICQRIANLHGGGIVAKNGVKGAEFTLELPAGMECASVKEEKLIHSSSELLVFRKEEVVRHDYGETANTAEFMRINKERGRKSQLLIVDDEPLFRASVRCLLGELLQVRDHVNFVEVESAEAATQLMGQFEFDYVIADIDLGKRRINGYDFAMLVLRRFPNTRILIHSNKRKDELDRDVRQLENDRFMGFLPKPMRAPELLQFLACKSFETPARHASLRLGGEADGPAIETTKKKVLVVNDDDSVRVGLKFQLRAASADNVQVLEASGVSEALSVIGKNSVDIILSDINLGPNEPDGYELLKRVKANGGTDARFYMISGYPKDDEAPKAVSLGADGYLQLPVDNKHLRGILM